MVAHLLTARRRPACFYVGAILVSAILHGPGPSFGQTVNPRSAPVVPITSAGDAAITVHPPWREAPFRRVIIAPGESTAAAGTAGERLVYSNTLASIVAGFPGGYTISDDLTLTAPSGCRLTRYRFRVSGRSSPTACGGAPCGPFTVQFALHSACPNAGGSVIPGTSGEFSTQDDGDYEIEYVVPAETIATLPSRVWLSIKFDRNNAGVVLGTLPLVGFSEDLIDFPGFACNANLGGVPQAPYAGYYAEVFTDADCPAAYPGYHNIRPAASGIVPGSGITLADDIELGSEPCRLVAIEIGLRNRGLYDVEIRRNDDGLPKGGSTFGVDAVPGTTARFAVSIDGYTPGRVTFDPPVPLPEGPLWIVMKSNNNRSEWILTRHDARIGHTGSRYARYGLQGWSLEQPDDQAYGGMHAVLTCAGDPPVGACCDMLQLDEQGESVCRELPKMNCAWPLPGSTLHPDWVPGATCAEQPFPFPCGASACCKPDDTCRNLARAECNAVEPVDVPRVWDRGQYCGEDRQACPWSACLVHEGTCATQHAGVGCENPYCCDAVCDADPWCCQVDWDRECIRVVDRECTTAPTFDDCFEDDDHHALMIEATGTTVFANSAADNPTSDPPFPCRLGAEAVCAGGPRAALACQINQDCPQSSCRLVLLPDQRAFHTVWFRFRATADSASISLCGSDAGLDSVLQVLSVGDDSDGSTACSTLTPVDCLDDSPGCSDTNRHARRCITGLVPDNLYYIAVGSKTIDDAGLYKLVLRSPCQATDRTPVNDAMAGAVDLDLGVRMPFDLVDATPDGNADGCASSNAADVWYAFDPTSSGWYTVRTDVKLGDPQSIALVTYRHTPDMEGSVFEYACGTEGPADDKPGVVTVYLNADDDLLIRAAQMGPTPTFGDVIIEATSEPTCPPLRLEPFQPPIGVVDAGRPHAPDSTESLAGIDTFRFFYDVEDDLVESMLNPACWTICTSDFNDHLHPPYSPDELVNRIEHLRNVGSGVAELVLKRPVTPGEITKVAYVDVNGRVSTLGPVIALPGDVNGDRFATAADVLELIDALNDTACTPPDCPGPWGAFSTDIDHSGVSTASDVLELIDLFNGAGAFESFLNASVPAADITCP